MADKKPIQFDAPFAKMQARVFARAMKSVLINACFNYLVGAGLGRGDAVRLTAELFYVSQRTVERNIREAAILTSFIQTHAPEEVDAILVGDNIPDVVSRLRAEGAMWFDRGP